MSSNVCELRAQSRPDIEPTRVFENAVVRLLKNKPFYGHLLMGFRRRISSQNYAIGLTVVNGTPTLNIDPSKFAEHSILQQQALLEHVTKHLLHLHPVRGRGHHPLLWSMAADLAINSGIQHLPADVPLPSQFNLDEGLAAEDYVHLLKAQFDLGNQKGTGFGSDDQGVGEKSGGGSDNAHKGQSLPSPIDDHLIWEEAKATPECLAEQAVRDSIKEAHRKSHGELPEDMEELVMGWLSPPEIPWKLVLSQFIGTAGRMGRKSTWLRQHRRFQYDTPGFRKRRQLNLLVAIDVSESTDEKPLRESFARELLQIAKGRDSRITVLYAHSRIRRIDNFNSHQAVAEVIHGGGFTDLRPVFDFAREMCPSPAAVVYLTDGYGPAPEEMIFPTLWVLTPGGQKPTEWGVELRLSGLT